MALVVVNKLSLKAQLTQLLQKNICLCNNNFNCHVSRMVAILSLHDKSNKTLRPR